MSKCILNIDLDKTSAHFEGGDDITGTLHVRATSKCTCSKLTIATICSPEMPDSSSCRDREVLATDEVFNEGDELEFDFSLYVPPGGPFTCEGEMIDVGWKVEATAEIDWHLDACEEQPIRVEPGSSDYFVFDHADYLTEENASFGFFGYLGFILSTISLLALLVVTGFLAVVLFPWMAIPLGSIDYSVSSIDYTVMMVTMVSLSSILFGRWKKTFSKIFFEHALESLDLSVTPKRASPGETVTVRVSAIPKFPITLGNADLTIRGKEVRFEGFIKENRRPVYEKALWKEARSEAFAVDQKLSLEGPENKKISAGEEMTFSSSFQIPDDSPYTFEADKNKIRWYATAYLDLHWITEFRTIQPFIVRPRFPEET